MINSLIIRVKTGYNQLGLRIRMFWSDPDPYLEKVVSGYPSKKRVWSGPEMSGFKNNIKLTSNRTFIFMFIEQIYRVRFGSGLGFIFEVWILIFLMVLFSRGGSGGN